jgi:hypothetical protein
MEKYIRIEGFYESVKDAQRHQAIENGQVFICRMKGINFKTLQYGVFDPSLNDIIQIVAVFRNIEDAITFVEAQY